MNREWTRRSFLRGGLAAACALGAGAAHARAEESRRRLLLVQLSGGNDGLSMLVPHAEPAYYRARPELALAKDCLLPIDERRAWHPELSGLAALFEQGGVGVIEGVGYRKPTRSHFKALDVLHTADRRGREAGDGWVARLARRAWPDEAPAGLLVHVGDEPLYALQSADRRPLCFESARDFGWSAADEERALASSLANQPAGSAHVDRLRCLYRDAQRESAAVQDAARTYRPRVEYGQDRWSRALRDVAALLAADHPSRVLAVELRGFDTHQSQHLSYPRLARSLDRTLCTFLRDVAGTPAGEQLVVLVYSEFGRRIAQNASGGTDHGAAAPMLLVGAPVEGGLYGAPPSFTELEDGDLAATVDFRSVYATLIERWFGVDAEPVLAARYPTLDCLR